jgi:ABC-2 type transport system permease protein
MFTQSPTLPRSALRTLAATEVRLYLREYVGLLWGVAFPLILLLGIGSIPSAQQASKDLGGLRFIDVYVPVLLAFVFAMLGLNAVPPVLAAYREKGVLRRLSTTPLPPSWVLAVQLAINLALAGIAAALLIGVGHLAFHIRLPAQPAGFVLSAILAAAAMLGLGLLLAAVAPTTRVASMTGAMLFFPMMFLAGLWVPRPAMPAMLERISDLSPLGAGVQALQDASVGHWPQPLHLAVMAAYVLVFGVAAARLFRWE